MSVCDLSYALRNIDEEEKKFFYDYYLDLFSTQELAQQYNMSQTTVRGRAGRLRRKVIDDYTFSLPSSR
jgi:DNA-directed RNA polymerase specialized sigma24 family protein